MRIRFRIIVLAFCLSFILMVMLTIYAGEQFVSFKVSTTSIDNANRAITQLQAIESLLKDIELDERQLKFRADSSSVIDFQKKVEELNSTLINLKGNVSNNSQHNLLVLFRSNISLRKYYLKERLKDSSFQNQQHLDSITATLRNESSGYISKLLKSEHEVLNDNLHLRENSQDRASYSIIYVLLILFAGTLIFFFLMIYQLRKRMRYYNALQTNIVDLTNTNLELEQIAHATSHNLKEPLRKIKVFADRLTLNEHSDTPDIKNMAERIISSAGDMQVLVTDLERLATLSKDNLNDTVDLTSVISLIIEENTAKIKDTNAKFTIKELPIINGNKEQISILFESLLDNSLKFTRNNVNPLITISAGIIDGAELQNLPDGFKGRKFNEIRFTDNGIGFDNIYRDKIFDLFQKLQITEDENEGKGIGLTIVRRIMTNHKGFVTANGKIDGGTEFNLYFPIN